MVNKRNRYINTALVFIIGLILGILAKWLDGISIDNAIWWHGLIESLDLGNFFSEMAIWLLLALIIAIRSSSNIRAALNVFVFFAGMCVSYHLYSVIVSGFNPFSYMMIWYGITLLSPLAGWICHYSRKKGTLTLIADALIMSVFLLSCFSIGFFYCDIRGVLYLMVYAGALAVLYENPRQLLCSLLLSIPLAFLINPIWPFH